ncbi:MAG: hypothetical protein LBR72_05830 [Oscillospiraceae bacterium]|nr:hypothetical protein [Oscillospiraceae bacterium]
MDAQFFLGANTPQGFVSYYNKWLNYNRLNRLFIIKGAPGNGKSSFMKRIAAKLEDQEREVILCSGDTSAWDGVYFSNLGVAFADGTPPHAMEPRYPLAVEMYLPLTQFVDDAAISRERKTAIFLQDSLREDYARLYRVLGAVKSLQDEQKALITDLDALEVLRRRTRGIIRREIKKGSGNGALRRRFLSAFSPDGAETLWDTVSLLADRVYELQDSYRQAHAVLSPVCTAALEAGSEVIACYDPFAPTTRPAHLILPEARLAFVSAPPKTPYPAEPFRRIRLDAAIPQPLLKSHRLRLRFLKKTENALLDDVNGILAGIAERHRQLEDLYNPHVDFSGVRALADAYAGKILADWEKQQ